MSLYSILQQPGSTCFIAAFLNLENVAAMPRAYFRLPWQNKFAWLIRTFPAIRDWHLCMRELITSNAEFRTYYTDLLTKGVRGENLPGILGITPIEDLSAVTPELLWISVTGDITFPHTSIGDSDYSITDVWTPLFHKEGKIYLYQERHGRIEEQQLATEAQGHIQIPLTINVYGTKITIYLTAAQDAYLGGVSNRLCPEFDTTPHILCGFRLITGQLI